jgi:hypothetical protein
MIDHETHLKQILENQKSLSNEIQELSNVLAIKKEQFLKLQGIVEYLSANGIKAEANEQVELPEKVEK